MAGLKERYTGNGCPDKLEKYLSRWESHSEPQTIEIHRGLWPKGIDKGFLVSAAPEELPDGRIWNLHFTLLPSPSMDIPMKPNEGLIKVKLDQGCDWAIEPQVGLLVAVTGVGGECVNLKVLVPHPLTFQN